MDLLKDYQIDLTGIDGSKLSEDRIHTLEKLLKTVYGDSVQVEYLEQMKSKKNVVLLLNIHTTPPSHLAPLIAKLFISDTFEIEKQILESCHQNGLSVPEVISAEDGVILMYFLQGEPLVDRINRTFESNLIDELAIWYHKFHESLNSIKGDPRLRNFLLCDDTLYGLDFEEAKTGHWILDIAGVSASLLDTNPINDSRKRAMVWQLLEKYLSLRNEERTIELDQLFIETIADALTQTAEWRKDDRIRLPSKSN